MGITNAKFYAEFENVIFKVTKCAQSSIQKTV